MDNVEKKTVAYSLYGLDRSLWYAARQKAQAEGFTMRGLICNLLSAYVSGSIVSGSMSGRIGS